METIKFLGIIALPVIKTEETFDQKIMTAVKEQLSFDFNPEKHIYVHIPLPIVGAVYYAIFETKYTWRNAMKENIVIGSHPNLKARILNAPIPPQSRETLFRLIEKELGKNLPDDYKAFVPGFDGGIIKSEKTRLQLWKIQDLAKLNKSHKVAEFMGDFVIFGTDGGNEAFAFDYRDNKCSIVNFPLIPMTIKEVKTIAPNFEDFLNTL